ncbi:hypothetical protein [Methylobacterium sp. Leaf88]|uniref:phage head spike fiber domain-containing protein n=1 Tax=Methylobacterium sp. Leaf88 TaxID=1736244 RepID=UPI0006F650FE|nr:hypothetical protein [Methylobacterium sp. Leaf88]KQO76416.1 hypothetical protein ASF20_13795 [Methylobacterium sp. Leaf88]
MVENGIRTPNLPLGPIIEVIGHADAGGGARVLQRQSIEDFVQYLLGLAGLDPSVVAGLSQRLTDEIERAIEAEGALGTRLDGFVAALAAVNAALGQLPIFAEDQSFERAAQYGLHEGFGPVMVDADYRVIYLRRGRHWEFGVNLQVPGARAEDPSDHALNAGLAQAITDAEGRLIESVQAGVKRFARPVAFDAGAILPESDYEALALPDTSGQSQIWVERRSTGQRTPVSSPGSNNTGPRITTDGAVLWTSDRAPGLRGAAPGNRFWSRLDAPAEHPVLPFPSHSAWGDSMTWAGYTPGLATLLARPVYNFGIPGTTSVSVAARQGGGQKSYMPVTGIIPAAATAVTLTPAAAGPAEKIDNSAFSLTGTLAGVPGTFTWNGTGASFTRAAAGTAVAVGYATPFVVDPKTTIEGTSVPDHPDLINHFWAGRNNPVLSQVLADLRAMVASITSRSKRFTVSPIFNSTAEPIGSAGYNNIIAINRAIEAEWPNNYLRLDGVDLREFVVASFQGNSSQDVADHAQDLTPTSLRITNDALHMNEAGNAIIAKFYANFIARKGWLDLIPPGNVIPNVGDMTDAAWTRQLVTLAAAAGVRAPDGYGTPTLISETSATGNHFIVRAAPAVAAGSKQRFAVLLKAAGRSRCTLALNTPSASGQAILGGVNLAAGTIGGTTGTNGTTVVSSGIIDCGNGWFLVFITATRTSGTDYSLVITLADDTGATSYAGDTTKGLLAWGASLSPVA